MPPPPGFDLSVGAVAPGATIVSKDQAVRHLAGLHYQIEPGLSRVFRLHAVGDVESRPEEPIKLLEVNACTVPLGIMPLGFGPLPAAGIDYPSIIVEVTPEEFERIGLGELTLPHGWTLGEVIAPPEAEVAR
jgi:hypothetical protein